MAHHKTVTVKLIDFIDFVKIEGAGNDFILFDHRPGNLNKYFPGIIPAICDRNFGIGADGVILLESSQKADYFMRYYNRDGSLADMCGNGARCIARYALEKSFVSGSHHLEAASGVYPVNFYDDGQIGVEFGLPSKLVTYQGIKIKNQKISLNYLNTGVPHAVIDTQHIETVEVDSIGSLIRNHDQFQPEGCNVNFIQQIGETSFFIRTFERGVEKETLACGTGVIAAGWTIAQNKKNILNLEFHTHGQKKLIVKFIYENSEVNKVELIGNATIVYYGQIDPGQFLENHRSQGAAYGAKN